MANYATNNFFAQTENEKDLITIEQFIEENFCDNYIARHGQCVESEFYSNGSVRKRDEWTYFFIGSSKANLH